MTAPMDDQLTLNRQATMARLVSGAAHEVNNALQVISGSVELLITAQSCPSRCASGWSASPRTRHGRRRR